MPTNPTPFTPLSTPPSTSDAANFDSRADTFLGELPTFQTEANDWGTVTYDNAVEATAAADVAVLSATAAGSYANATTWVSGGNYSLGVSVFSPADSLLYRCILAAIGRTTDPSTDTSYWERKIQPISGGGTGAISALAARTSLGVQAEIGIVSGTRMPFAQATAPTGWTQDVSDNANNRMLRVVSSAGAGVGGTHSPILNNVVPSHTHGFTTGNISADHNHAISDPGHTHGSQMLTYRASSGINHGGGSQNMASLDTQSATTGITTGGVSANHTHSGTTDNGSSSTNWTPRYNDMIICVKN